MTVVACSDAVGVSGRVSAARSPAAVGRASARAARPLITASSTRSGTSGARSRTGGIGVWMASTSSPSEATWRGGRPVSSSYRTAASP